MTTLETNRLILRPFQETDLDDLCALYSDPDVMRYLNAGALNRDETAVRLQRMLDHWQTHGYGVWAVIHKKDDRFIGRCGIANVHDFADRELVYTFARAYWGQGYATEAARAALDYAFTYLKLPRVIALAVADNLASRNVMRKLAMTFEKVVPFLGHEAMLHGLNNPHTSP
jgi:RimJ/RimL family protein N-acetyltransferase